MRCLRMWCLITIYVALSYTYMFLLWGQSAIIIINLKHHILKHHILELPNKAGRHLTAQCRTKDPQAASSSGARFAHRALRPAAPTTTTTTTTTTTATNNN